MTVYDTYKTKEAKRVNVNFLSANRQTEMIHNDWKIKISNITETSQELYDRLSQVYNKVKIYYTTTSVRGYYAIFAMVK